MRPKRQRPALYRLVDGLLAILVLLASWQLGAWHIQRPIILPSPELVWSSFSTLLGQPRFWAAMAATAWRGLAAFALALLLGTVCGFAVGLWPRARNWSRPPLLIIRATPVLAIVLLAMIWFPADLVPVFSAFIMAFPVVLTEVSAGVRSVDPKLVEMAQLFRVSWWRTTLHVRLPAAAPHLVAAARNALGLAWKVVVAGEVLSQPQRAIGTGMQSARVMLETSEVFAWAAAGILLCAASDALFDALVYLYYRIREKQA